jgi:hypothetical protein
MLSCGAELRNTLISYWDDRDDPGGFIVAVTLTPAALPTNTQDAPGPSKLPDDAGRAPVDTGRVPIDPGRAPVEPRWIEIAR